MWSGSPVAITAESYSRAVATTKASPAWRDAILAAPSSLRRAERFAASGRRQGRRDHSVACRPPHRTEIRGTPRREPAPGSGQGPDTHRRSLVSRELVPPEPGVPLPEPAHSRPRRPGSALRPSAARFGQLRPGHRTLCLFELVEEIAQLLTLELVGHRSRDETGKPARANAPPDRISQFRRNADRKLRSRPGPG